MPINVYISRDLKARMDAAEAAQKVQEQGSINWSEVAQRAFARECERLERVHSGRPSVEDVDVAAIAERSQRGYEDSYEVAYASALTAAEAMEYDDIEFLDEYDDSVDAYVKLHGRIDPYDGDANQPWQYEEWRLNLETRRDLLIAGPVEAAEAHCEKEGLRFNRERAISAAMRVFAEVCSEVQRHWMSEAIDAETN